MQFALDFSIQKSGRAIDDGRWSVAVAGSHASSVRQRGGRALQGGGTALGRERGGRPISGGSVDWEERKTTQRR